MLSPITKKQHEIIMLIYRFRFIDRTQFQTILHHKNHRRIQSWLTDLVTKNFLQKIYTKTFPNNTKPTIYYLGPQGRKYLIRNFKEKYPTQKETNTKEASLYQLTKTYKDTQRSEVFRSSCLALVDCFISVTKEYNDNPEYKTTFASLTECATYNLLNKFDSYLSVQKKNGHKTRYVFLYITNRQPRRFIRYRIAEIIKFLGTEWENETTQPLPILLVLCSNFPIKTYAKKIFTTKISSYHAFSLSIHLSTLYELKTKGLKSSIWHKLVVEE